ncbi:MAG: Methionyl-tRNA formyltransferase [Acidobacteria bacterium]|nr:Methionyl-tRNA formyltransferase [Acidobacteriota bacterium]
MVNSSTPLRIVFFGTPEFAVPSLDALLTGSAHIVAGVITQPDRPRGRGHKTSDAPVKARAAAAGLPVLQPARMKDPAFLDALAAWHADLGVVAAYGRILTDEILAMPRLGMINVHASLLPRYRGAAPVHRAVIAGETMTGVTIMRVVRALDAGGMILKGERPIGPDETSDEVERDLAQIGARLLMTAVDQIANGAAHEAPQDESLATYAHRLTKDDGLIDWNWPATRIHNAIRGLHPWPHAFSFVQGKRVILRRSANDASDSNPRQPAGTIVEADGDRLVIATGDAALRITEIQAEGKRPMTPRDFLSGHRLRAGERFSAAP